MIIRKYPSSLQHDQSDCAAAVVYGSMDVSGGAIASVSVSEMDKDMANKSDKRDGKNDGWIKVF